MWRSEKQTVIDSKITVALFFEKFTGYILQLYLYVYLLTNRIHTSGPANEIDPHVARCGPPTRSTSTSNDRLEDNDRGGPVSFDWTKLTETIP